MASLKFATGISNHYRRSKSEAEHAWVHDG